LTASLGLEETTPGVATHRRPNRPAPAVVAATPAGTLATMDAGVEVVFSQPMRRNTVESSFQIRPGVEVTPQWLDDHTVVFRPASLAFRTTYSVEVAGTSQEGRSAPATTWSFTTPPPAAPAVTGPFTLTFDDCGTPQQVQAILAALEARGLRAVFFPTGLCRDTYPWLVPTLLAKGHRVCNHTYSHPFLTRLSNDAIRAQIANGVHADCDLFRPPYGDWDGPRGRVVAIAASLGYRVQMWDVDTRDWAGTGAAAMVTMIRARGGVVLMHMHGRHTAEALLLL
jgi:peptidoglycan/xylan/chitin deacetylase (PgdA/CDA1 family)